MKMTRKTGRLLALGLALLMALPAGALALTIDTTVFGGDSDQLLECAAQLPDGYILGGTDDNGEDAIDGGVAIALRTDADGNVLWTLRYRQGDKRNRIARIMPQPDGTLLLLYLHFTDDVTTGELLQVSAQGELLSAAPLPDLHEFTSAWLPTGDGLLLFTESGQMVRVDAQGDILWRRETIFPDIYIANVMPVDDGNLLFYGSSVTEDNPMANGLVGLADAEGNLLWRADDTIPGEQADISYIDGVRTADGGVVLSGSRYSQLPEGENGWVTKLYGVHARYDAQGNRQWFVITQPDEGGVTWDTVAQLGEDFLLMGQSYYLDEKYLCMQVISGVDGTVLQDIREPAPDFVDWYYPCELFAVDDTHAVAAMSITRTIDGEQFLGDFDMILSAFAF